MEGMCSQVVDMIERQRHCRLIKASFNFVQDLNAKIWLLGCSECQIVVSTDEIKRFVICGITVLPFSISFIIAKLSGI